MASSKPCFLPYQEFEIATKGTWFKKNEIRSPEFIMMDEWTLRREEESIREQVRQSDDLKRKRFYELCTEKLKDPDSFAALAWSLPVGLHHAYLGNWSKLGLVWVVFVVGLFLLALEQFLIGTLVILLVLGMELHSLFCSQLIVMARNNELMKKILRDL